MHCLNQTKSKNFNFVFNFGYRNQLNTIKGQYTKDMIIEQSITTDLILSDEEMNSIYIEMKKINILAYPEFFNPKSYTYNSVTPSILQFLIQTVPVHLVHLIL